MDVEQANIPFAAFNSANVRSVEASSRGELFLRYSRCEAKLPQAFTETHKVWIHQA